MLYLYVRSENLITFFDFEFLSPFTLFCALFSHTYVAPLATLIIINIILTYTDLHGAKLLPMCGKNNMFSIHDPPCCKDYFCAYRYMCMLHVFKLCIAFNNIIILGLTQCIYIRLAIVKIKQ